MKVYFKVTAELELPDEVDELKGLAIEDIVITEPRLFIREDEDSEEIEMEDFGEYFTTDKLSELVEGIRA